MNNRLKLCRAYGQNKCGQGALTPLFTAQEHKETDWRGKPQMGHAEDNPIGNPEHIDYGQEWICVLQNLKVVLSLHFALDRRGRDMDLLQQMLNSKN